MKLEELRFDPATGLLPVVVQQAETRDVLTLAYADREALRRTQETGLAHFWSRKRGKLWMKGEESGNIQHVVEIRVDCDMDAVLYLVSPKGPACHTGKMSCFHNNLEAQKL